MAFRFRYEALLSYRAHLKERAEMELYNASSQLNRIRALIRDLEDQRHRSTEDLKKALFRVIRAEEIRNRADYISGLKERLASHRSELLHWKEIVEKKRKELLEKVKAYEMLKRLKERDLARWKEHLELVERKRENEVSIQRHQRRFL